MMNIRDEQRFTASRDALRECGHQANVRADEISDACCAPSLGFLGAEGWSRDGDRIGVETKVCGVCHIDHHGALEASVWSPPSDRA
jgi:hypothetical protein